MNKKNKADIAAFSLGSLIAVCLLTMLPSCSELLEQAGEGLERDMVREESHRQDLLAAIRDSGCNSHKQLHIEQEHTLRIDKYNLKKGFGDE